MFVASLFLNCFSDFIFSVFPIVHTFALYWKHVVPYEVYILYLQIGLFHEAQICTVFQSDKTENVNAYEL